MKQILFCILLSAACQIAHGADTDGDGLLDFLDASGFDPILVRGDVSFADAGIQDLDGVNIVKYVTRLNLSGNLITSIESGDFDGLVNLRHLFLGRNQIASVEDGDFQGLENLEILSLSGNLITSIESGDFKGLGNLQHLALDMNQLTNIKSNDFQGLENLEILNLSRNQITNIERGAFLELGNLRSLALWGNYITNIDFLSYGGLDNLQGLTLPENQITTIEHGDFQGFANLIWLTLDGNGITNIEGGSFDGLDNLGVLTLSKNQIASISQDAFRWLKNLTLLDLSENQLTRIESDDFQTLENLLSLNLAHNDIASIQDGAFRGMRSLSSLDLRGGHLPGVNNPFTVLNFDGATFDSLEPCTFTEFGDRGLCVNDFLTALTLDDAVLSNASFEVILHATESITNVSLVGLSFSDTNPTDLSSLLGIETLESVRVDESLFARYSGEFDAFAAKLGHTVSVAGDFDGNRHLTITDLDQLATAIRNGETSTAFDLSDDGTVDLADADIWVHQLKHTWFGDANLDGEFDSSDLVSVFQAGQYEDAIEGNSVWASGDWDMDGDFTTSDLVAAFKDGGYGKGPLVTVASVPEPPGHAVFLMAIFVWFLQLPTIRGGNRRSLRPTSD
ncbi:MAG: leucine-rich repeat domain-containing protein [Planctomycetales bacterium]|nr:leucine-rich repeat domain-containing protein [Planctomycetales bacterium]